MRVAIVGLVLLASVPAVALAKPSPAARVRADWLHELSRRAEQDPQSTFPNLPRAVWFARVRSLEKRYRFSVVEVRMLRPVQDAPLLVVRTTRSPKAFARDVPAIQRSLDPKQRTGDDRTGWVYEGFYLEARDAHGRPFLAVFNYWRGTPKGGGQWASSPAYYPYAHG
jgi:hypothetical protein